MEAKRPLVGFVPGVGFDANAHENRLTPAAIDAFQLGLPYWATVSWSVDMPPKTEGILESSLYVDDLHRSVQFYEKVFGFRVISDFGVRGCAMDAGSRQVLLLFKKGGSRAIQSPHDGDGELHVAFAIGAAELSRWEAWLSENGIATEEKRVWELGGVSIYFRDPDRHLIELATPGTWSIY
jgi:catechol 2,3-dioxygenase-like lactoylglutathione lyase family enzyme